MSVELYKCCPGICPLCHPFLVTIILGLRIVTMSSGITPIILDVDGDVRLCIPGKRNEEASSDQKDNSGAGSVGSSDGGTEVELVVSSKVLCVVSPVFKAMLKGYFKEATELSKMTALSQQYTLKLHEDDPEAATIMFALFHHEHDHIPSAPSTRCLEELAFFCDKYQCTHVMKHCGTNWLRDPKYNRSKHNLKRWDVEIVRLCRCLVFSYVFDLAEDFTRFAWSILLSHKGPICGPDTAAKLLIDHPLLRHEIARRLDAKRFELCQIYHAALMNPMTRDWKSLSGGCVRAGKAVGDYLKWLRHLEILEHDLEFSSHSFWHLLDKPLSGSDTPISTEHYPCVIYGCPCRSDIKTPNNLDLRTPLRAAIHRIQFHEPDVLCLDCIKTNERSTMDETCRIMHSFKGRALSDTKVLGR
ncbi:hypothetical protein B0T25DRAFT_250161 [Lasiosphaeria hispida]|uniref:BTB domain-containing protein n=1 Tax=Lasiosphaeria hispida TaxID=260671 RepID=A0AAJ0MCR0_9PEZI|nr:hypothetical protein B0T25DRAFT_250161 [Lasiosphaeria hispida]